MGEISKKRGEFGEMVVEQLLRIIGWDNPLTGREIECHKPLDHSISTKDRKDHGVDFVYQYACPLFSDTQQFVLVSSKYNDSYPSSPGTKFKSHLRDIAYAVDCFRKSNLRSKLKEQNIRSDSKIAGVIFWIDNGSSYNDVIDRLLDFRIEDDLEFDTVYLVDNHRADFLFDTIDFAQKKFPEPEHIIEFIHPNTGYNSTAKNRLTSSPVLPVQYINNSILPIKVTSATQDHGFLLLNCIDPFEEDYFRKLISLAQKLTENWVQKVFILFPEYNGNVHGEKVEDVKLEFKDRRFVSKVTVFYHTAKASAP
jgi:hypothetical protein